MGKEFLLEVGTEEIPAGILPPTLEQMRGSAGRLLKEYRLAAEAIEVWGTPRRLVLFVDGLPDRQAAQDREVLGPAKRIAFDEHGRPTPAAVGFAKSQQIDVSDLRVKETEKGAYLCVVRREACKPAHAALADLVASLLGELTFPKAMVWNETGARFVRPIRWIVAVFDGKVVPFAFAGVKSGDRTRGHRQETPGEVRVKDLKSYRKACSSRGVVVDPAERLAMIRRDLDAGAKAAGGKVLEDEGLLSHAVYSVERPAVFSGGFDARYLELPREVLITVLRRHQYYFGIADKKGGLLPKFLAVSNHRAKNMTIIREGNERVLRARLEDAAFFLKEDLKIRIDARVAKLSGMVFQEKLGTVLDKVERLKRLASIVAKGIDMGAENAAVRAAGLSKADLLTGMVGEFPELQGIMGREYARRQGEPEAVSEAIGEQYLPRFAGDALPHTPAGRVLALADRLDTIAGCFAAGLIPTGSQDPYALRRQGQGIVQMIIASRAHVSLRDLISEALAGYAGKIKCDPRSVQGGIRDFLRQRLQAVLEGEGHRYDLVDAVLAVTADDPYEAAERARALSAFRRETDFDGLMVPFKRALNILPEGFSKQVAEESLGHPAEKALWKAFRGIREKTAGMAAERRHEALLKTMTELKGPIDGFFNDVLVMDPDPAVRDNRLALLKSVVDLFSSFADFRKVVVETAPASR